MIYVYSLVRGLLCLSIDKYTQRTKLILIGPCEFGIIIARHIRAVGIVKKILSSRRKKFCFSAIRLAEITNEFIMEIFDKTDDSKGMRLIVVKLNPNSNV